MSRRHLLTFVTFNYITDELGPLSIRRTDVGGAAITCAKDECPSVSLACPPGLAVFLRDLDIDRRAKTKFEPFW